MAREFTRSLGCLLMLMALLLSPVASAQDGTASAAAPAADSRSATTSASEEPLYPLSAERREKLAAYAQFNNLWRFADFFIGIGILALILFSGLSARLRDFARRHARRPFFVLWLYLTGFLVVEYLLGLPFAIYRGFLVESDFGFVNQSFLEWWGESLLSLLISLFITIIPVAFLYWLINRSRFWWAWFSIGAVPFLVIMMVVAPVVIAPLFNDYEPLDDPAVEQRVLALADKAGIEGADVFQVNASKQSSKVNAYVTGLFGSKRIVLYDNLIKHFDPAEIEFVMGHEMGHYVMHHVWYSLLVIAVFLAFSLWLMNRWIHPLIARYRKRFGFDRLGDIASLPLILIFLSVIGFFLNPVTNGVSRYFEHQADIYGMEISGVPGETAATAFDKLSAYNLADPDPNPLMEFWFYNHPSLASRMAFVRNYRSAKEAQTE